jgi:hypothetical protein
MKSRVWFDKFFPWLDADERPQAEQQATFVKTLVGKEVKYAGIAVGTISAATLRKHGGRSFVEMEIEPIVDVNMTRSVSGPLTMRSIKV